MDGVNGQNSVPVPENCLKGGGEMGALMRSFDWSSSRIGPVAEWSQSLRTAASICLNSRFPMVVWWGPEFVLLYNDAWRPVLGTKHPSALGRTGQEVWAEIWDIIGAQLHEVLATGQATWSDDLLLMVERYGYAEEAYFTYSYSPILDEAGDVGGAFTAVSETTQRVLGERRLATLRDLAVQAGQAKTAEQACQMATQTIAHNPTDIPFALLYLLQDEATQALLCSCTPLEIGTIASSRWVDLTPEADSTNPGWSFATVVETGAFLRIDDLQQRFEPLPSGPWDRSPTQAVVLPIWAVGQERPTALMVVGVNPCRALDDDYQNFFEMTAGYVGTAIANARAYEEERKRAEALAELDRAKTIFFSNVSHEFRTPLTLMLGPLEDALATVGGTLPPEQYHQLEMVHRNSLRLLKLVNTLLDFSRIEAGRVQAVYELTDLAVLTAELASVFRSAIERVGIQLVVDCPPLPEQVYVDRDMWEKIVLNLLSNAFKFTFSGEIAVLLRGCDSLSPSDSPSETLRERDDKAERAIELIIQDTGTGIPAHELPHLFERFHRVDGAQGRTHEGSGIGLALVQELVKLHGGTISVSSVVNVGTTFTVKIPTGSSHLPPDRISTSRSFVSTALGAAPYIEEAMRWIPEAAREEAQEILVQRSETEEALDFSLQLPQRGDSSFHLAEARILLVDDNADMRDYVRRLLSTRYTVEAVGDGLAALEAVRNQIPDLVLSDMMMPGLDGFGLLQALRSQPETREIPVILLSARAAEESRIEGLEAGADDYLVKPFSARELLARVKANLELASVRQEAANVERRARSEAEAARQRISSILESITDAFVAFDREWRYTYVNEEAGQLLKIAPEDLLGKQLWQDVFQDGIGTAFEREFKRAIAEQTMVEFEEYYPAFQVWYEVRAYPSAEGLAVYFRDVTGRRRIETAQRFLTEASSVLAASLDQQVVLTNLTHLIVPTLADFCYFDVIIEDKIQRTAWHHRDPAQQEFFSQIQQFVPPQAFQTHPVASVLHSGEATLVSIASDRWMQAIATSEAHLQFIRNLQIRSLLTVPLIANHRTLGVLTCCVTSLSERNYGEADLALAQELAHRAALALDNARLYQEAQTINRLKDEFLATLSHELRSPLNAMLGWTTLLRTRQFDEATTRRALETIERNARAQTQLVEDLLDMSRIIRGQLRLNVRPIELIDVIESAVDTARPAADAKEIRLQLTLDPAAGPVLGDPDRLQQVIWNLLNNAVKFTPKGGRVQVCLERVNSHVEMTVTDTGKGISAEFLPRVFDRFRQADNSITRSYSGLGLGLAIVHHLVDLHGGTVQAESPGEGQGSTFTVKLPRVAVTPRLNQPDRVHPTANDTVPFDHSPDLGGLHILIVDDEADARELLKYLLQSCGAEVTTAADAARAIAILTNASTPFDVLISDIGMPGEDGYALLRRVRQLESSNRRIPAVALTAYARAEDRRAALLNGFQSHIAKPVEPGELTAVIANLTGRTETFR